MYKMFTNALTEIHCLGSRISQLLLRLQHYRHAQIKADIVFHYWINFTYLDTKHKMIAIALAFYVAGP